MEADRLEEARGFLGELLASNIEERGRLEMALAGLDGISAPKQQAAPPALDLIRPTHRSIPKRELRKLFLAEVARSPGITVTQASLRLQTTRDALVPVVKQVLAEKLVSKDGACYSLVKPAQKPDMSEQKEPRGPFNPGDRIGIPLGSDQVAQRPPAL
jgi:hypothetical protein